MERCVSIKKLDRWRYLAAAGFFWLSSGLQAATSVSGPITADTVWSVAQSPYQVTSDVSVENSATLTIEPGVTVYFGPGTSLIVNVGALKARGTAVSAIVFTSTKESVALTPAPGDWGQLRFLPGTFDATTVLEYVQVRFGQGISIQSASPTLNYLTITNNSGPAISMDLASSPVGIGNQASGNTLNGVVVPAGDILASVAWKLKGIPYVIQQGIVSVGQTPIINSVSPNQIQQGETLDVTLTGIRLAGVESIALSNPAITATILTGATATTIPVRLAASPTAILGPVAVEVQVAAGKPRLDNALTVIPPKPPIVVSSITPDFIRRGESKTFQATGQNLNGASVTTAGAGLTLSNVQSTATQITFTLAAGSDAALDTQTFTFTNLAIAAGSATATITVLSAPPKPTVSPAPLAVPPDGVQRSFAIRLSAADVLDHSFTLTITDTTVATVTPASVTILAGQTQVLAGIKGLKLGQTVLTLSSPTLGTTTAPIFVSSESAGLNTSYALALGVVITQQTPPPTTTTPLASTALGVVVGNYISGISPTTLTIGTGPVPMVISGGGLGAVTAVSVVPADGLTLGTPSANADGTSITVPVTIAADAPTTVRQVTVSAGTTRYLTARAEVDRIKVVLPPPTIDSIVPIYATPGSTGLALTLRGHNFRDLQSVTFTPADGIAVGPATVSVNGSGDQIDLSLNVAAGAPLGPRVVSVNTLGGSSSAVPSPANTFTIVNQIQQSFTPISTPLVGVVVEQPAAPPAPPAFTLATAAVGVAVGSVVTGISPAVGSIGDTISLSVQGFELNSVTAIQFIPATGLTVVGAPQVAADGKSATQQVTIATDAPQTLRTVQVLAGSQQLRFALPSAALFRIAPPQPRIDFISPLFLQVGAPLTGFTLQGINFQNAQTVRVLPPDGVTISNPVVNSDGTVLTVNMAAAANAVPGSRVVVVATPAGETSSTASAANTITLTTTAGTTFGPIATLLGVVKEPPPVPVSTTFGPITSPMLGLVFQQAPQPVSTPQFASALPIGVAVGAFAQSLAPTGIIAGQTATLTLFGANLNAVTSIGFLPSAGLSVGALTTNADGTQLSVPVTADAAAPGGPRQLTLTSASGPVQFSSQAANRFTVVPALPVIQSIDPILGTRGQDVSLVIRGTNLQYATGVTITPAAGITFGTSFTVDSAGLQLTIPLSIAIDAAAGARVIQVVTPASTTPADPSAANTFTVLQ